MEMTESDNQDIVELYLFFRKHWKKLLLISIIAAIAASIVTLRMPKRYTSTGLVYPPAFNSPSKLVDNPNFGYLIEADRLLQIAQSAQLKEGLFRNLNLAAYYQIDTTETDYRDQINRNLQRDISLERTKYMSVQIAATTSIPELSADIVNEIIRLIGECREQIFKDNFKSSLEFLRVQYEDQKKLVSSMMDSLHNLRNLNKVVSLDLKFRQLKDQKTKIESLQKKLADMRWDNRFFDLESRISGLNEQLLNAKQDQLNAQGKLDILNDKLNDSDTMIIANKARLRGAELRIESIESELNKLKDLSRPYGSLVDQLENEVSYYHSIKQEYENTEFAFEPQISSLAMEQFRKRYNFEQNQLDVLKSRYDLNLQKYEQPLPSIYVVEYGFPSYVKSSPSLVKNVLITVVPVLFFTILSLVIAGRISRHTNNQ